MSGGAHTSHYGLHTIGDRDNWRCVYCNCRLFCSACQPANKGARPITRDHVVPRSRGGANAMSNLAASCQSCNEEKSDRLLHEEKVEAERKAREGCTLGGGASRKLRPMKQYPTLDLAMLMCDTVNSNGGRGVQPWPCQHCDQWHISVPRTG